MADWAVERVVVGDGCTDDTGATLCRGQLYASEVRHGGNEIFWAVEEGSLQVWERRTPAERLKAALRFTNGQSAEDSEVTHQSCESSWNAGESVQ